MVTRPLQIGDLMSRLREAAKAGPQDDSWVTADWSLSADFFGSGSGISVTCTLTPTDTTYGVGLGAAILYTSDQETCYCGGLSWPNPNGLPDTGQIGVPLQVIAGTDLYNLSSGDTFTAVAGGWVYLSSTQEYQDFTITVTLTAP